LPVAHPRFSRWQPATIDGGVSPADGNPHIFHSFNGGVCVSAPSQREQLLPILRGMYTHTASQVDKHILFVRHLFRFSCGICFHLRLPCRFRASHGIRVLTSLRKSVGSRLRTSMGTREPDSPSKAVAPFVPHCCATTVHI
jgi:hypothetical protein